MDSIFKDFSQKILVYLSVSSSEDPLEFNTTESLLNSIPIRAIVSDYSFSKIRWSMNSVNTDRVKEILVEYKHKNLIEQSIKISIDGEDYLGWKTDSKLQYRKEGNYIRLLCYTQKA